MEEGALPGRILLDVARELGATLEIDRLLRVVLTRVTELFGAERALFALCDESGRIQRAVTHNLDLPEDGAPLPVSTGVIREAFESKQPVVVQNAEEDDHYSSRPSVERLGLRFMVAVPVPLDQLMLGVLYIDSRIEHVEDITDRIELLSAIARLVGTAVENARLFEEQKYRTRLLASLVHDFRTPLQVIDMNTRLLASASERSREMPAELDSMVRDIAACSQRLTRMAQTTLELCSMDSEQSSPKPETLAMGPAVEAHLRLLEIVADAVEVRFASSTESGVPDAHTVPDRVWIVLDNLIFNALKHASPGSTVTVTIRARDDAGPDSAIARAVERERRLFRRTEPLAGRPGSRYVEISVHNFGAPITDQRMSTIFSEFVRDESAPEGRASTGLGLSIVEQCVHQLGGAVWLGGSDARGTTFFFTLPSELA